MIFWLACSLFSGLATFPTSVPVVLPSLTYQPIWLLRFMQLSQSSTFHDWSCRLSEETAITPMRSFSTHSRRQILRFSFVRSLALLWFFMICHLEFHGKSGSSAVLAVNCFFFTASYLRHAAVLTQLFEAFPLVSWNIETIRCWVPLLSAHLAVWRTVDRRPQAHTSTQRERCTCGRRALAGQSYRRYWGVPWYGLEIGSCPWLGNVHTQSQDHPQHHSMYVMPLCCGLFSLYWWCPLGQHVSLLRPLQ